MLSNAIEPTVGEPGSVVLQPPSNASFGTRLVRLQESASDPLGVSSGSYRDAVAAGDVVSRAFGPTMSRLFAETALTPNYNGKIGNLSLWPDDQPLTYAVGTYLALKRRDEYGRGEQSGAFFFNRSGLSFDGEGGSFSLNSFYEPSGGGIFRADTTLGKIEIEYLLSFDENEVVIINRSDINPGTGAFIDGIEFGGVLGDSRNDDNFIFAEMEPAIAYNFYPFSQGSIFVENQNFLHMLRNSIHIIWKTVENHVRRLANSRIERVNMVVMFISKSVENCA